VIRVVDRVEEEMADTQRTDERADEAVPAERNAPAAWPSGMPYTVHFPDGDGYLDADLEHPAPLPRVGDTIEYVDEAGACRRYRVREVIHTLQSSAALRPTVEDEPASPNSLARVRGEPGERPGESGLLRAGLPKVLLEAID
jgi:hypothetical protein